MATIAIRVIDRTDTHPREARLARVFSKRIISALLKLLVSSGLSRRKEIAFSVILVTPRESRALNRKFRRRAYAANVLTFSNFKTPKAVSSASGSSIDLGDIIVSPAVIVKDAKKFKKSFYTQFFWTLTHGILHSIGFDHERSASEAKRMERLEREMLSHSRVRSESA